MRIGFATRDWSHGLDDPEPGDVPPTLGGSGHYRCGIPAEALAAAGHDVLLGGLVAHNKAAELGVRTVDGEIHWDFDVIVMQRWMIGDLPGRVAAAVAAGQVVFNDVDDWWEGMDPSNRAFGSSHPRLAKMNRAQARAEGKTYTVTENRDIYRAVIAASTGAIASTEFLQQKYPRATLIRNRIDLARWSVHEPVEQVIVGWVGGIPWRSSGDLRSLRGVLGPYVERHDLQVLHAGATPRAVSWEGEPLPSFAVAAGVPVERMLLRGLVPISEYPEQFQGMAIGLVPLVNAPFNHAKSAIKGMEYAAAGVPFVAQATPEYRWLAATHGIGRVARRPIDWIRHLEALIDPELRRAEALAGAERIRALDSRDPAYAAEYEEVFAAAIAEAGRAVR